MARLLVLIATMLVGLSEVAVGQISPAPEIAPGGKLRVGMIAITVLGGVAETVEICRTEAGCGR
jgi:polar amino acid transport system substrate-binding protein